MAPAACESQSQHRMSSLSGRCRQHVQLPYACKMLVLESACAPSYLHQLSGLTEAALQGQAVQPVEIASVQPCTAVAFLSPSACIAAYQVTCCRLNAAVTPLVQL